MSSTTSLIMMASDNVWDEEVALIGGGMLSILTFPRTCIWHI